MPQLIVCKYQLSIKLSIMSYGCLLHWFINPHKTISKHAFVSFDESFDLIGISIFTEAHDHFLKKTPPPPKKKKNIKNPSSPNAHGPKPNRSSLCCFLLVFGPNNNQTTNQNQKKHLNPPHVFSPGPGILD